MNECPRCGRLPGNSHTEICALQGEIERLRHDIKRHIAIASELATENEGLRDELARKAEGYTRLAEVHEGAMKMWESDERECAMKAYEMAAELKGLREEVERLRAELASWQEAFGLLTTLHGSIQIDSSDPMGMAKQIESHVRATIPRLRVELAKADGQINRCVYQNKYLESTISRLREYARHDPSCKSWGRIPYPSDCGYDELMKELEESK